jgi:alpha,alpha-trehalase
MEGAHFSGSLWDLDGVLTRTATVHETAWKHLFDDLLKERAAGAPFLHEDYIVHVDGKVREDGIRSFLAFRQIRIPEGHPGDGPERMTVYGLGARKQLLFLHYLEKIGVEVDEAAVRLLYAMRGRGIRTAIVTSSRNGREVLRRAGLEELFEARVDGVVAEELRLRGKPAPDLFLEGARRIAVAPERAVVLEDAISGVMAGRAGGFGLVIGVDRGSHEDALLAAGANLVVHDFAQVTFASVDAWFATRECAI